MKYQSVLACLLFVLFPFALLGESYPTCSGATGNRITRLPGIPAGYNLSLSTTCDYRVPDLRVFYTTSRGSGWRLLGSLTQSPAPGTLVSVASGLCPNTTIPVTITAIFHHDNRTPLNSRDDRYCQASIADNFYIEDKHAPVIRALTITTSDLDFSASHLKTHFTSAYLSDNCTPLNVLQNNLELAPDPARPAMVSLLCGSSNSYVVLMRTRDACNNYSAYSLITVRFRDTQAPVISLYGPYLLLGADCRIRINQTTVTPFIMDASPAAGITKSYRIIAPLSLAGNIPPGGRYLNLAGLCPAETNISIRVCAQDCFGNGNLNLDNNNASSPGCTYVTLPISDTSDPIYISGCGDTSMLYETSLCQSIMPNLAPAINATDFCAGTAISIYQFPEPGAILNDGLPDGIGLALGVPRSYTTSFIKPGDPYIDCANSPSLIKYISVSFIIVDCDGNSTLKENCKTIRLVRSNDGLAGYSKPLSNNLSPSFITRADITMDNFPNPFNNQTDIRIQSDQNSEGQIIFYNLHGQQIYSKNVSIQMGTNTVSVNKNDLVVTGLIYYTLVINKNRNSIRNKMIIY